MSVVRIVVAVSLLVFMMALAGCNDGSEVTPDFGDDVRADAEDDVDADADADLDDLSDVANDCEFDDECSPDEYCDDVCRAGCHLEPDNCQIGECDELTRECTYDSRYEPLVEAVLAEMESYGAPGAAVAVLEDGEVSFAFGVGSKSPDDFEPVMPTTLFRVGSVSKTLTTVGLLRLVDSDDVDLDAPIADYLPDLVFSKDETLSERVLVRHLITHTSGLPEFVVWYPPGCESEDCLSSIAHGSFAENGYAASPPGRLFNYSNAGLSIVGLINETVSGVSYEQYMRERVFEPLGMTRTTVSPRVVRRDGDFAFGVQGVGTFGPSTENNTWHSPSHGVFSSVLDLAEYMTFVRGGNTDILSTALFESMLQTQVNTEIMGDLETMGFGFWLRSGFFDAPYLEGDSLEADYYGVSIIEHIGSHFGFGSLFAYSPELDCGFIALSNGDGAHLYHSFVTTLRTVCDGPDPTTTPSQLDIEPGNFATFTGEYVDPNVLGTADVSLESDQLRCELEGGSIRGTFDLEPIWRNTFWLRYVGSEEWVTFILDGEGQPEFLRFLYGPVAEFGE